MIKNKILKQVVDGIEQKVEPEMRGAYDRIVTAGLKIMFGEETHDMMAKELEKEGDIATNVADGISRLIALLYVKSKETMPIPAAILASITLMAEALDFAERKMGVPVTNDVVDAAAEATAEQVLRKFGVTPENLQQLVSNVQQGQSGAQAPTQSQPQGGLLGA